MQQKPKFLSVLHCIPSILPYLPQVDRVKLLRVNTLLRNYLLDSNCWESLEYTDFQMKPENWLNHCRWIEKYLPIIKPIKLSILITEDHNSEQIINTLRLTKTESVEKLEVYCEIQTINLAISLCFSMATELIMKSRCFSDELLMFMCQNMKKIHSLTVIKNDMNFTAKNLSKLIVEPMEKILFKPYVLQFQQICQITQRSQNTLRELQLDVEECSKKTIVQLLSPLKKLQILRLFHLQNFQTDNQLFPIIQEQRLRQFSITKAYDLPMNRIIRSLKSLDLVHLSLTDSKMLDDKDIINLSKGSPNLKHINLSWCHSLSTDGIRKVLQNCLKLQEIYLTGLKELEDRVFGAYYDLMEIFDESRYNERRQKILKDSSDQFYPVQDFFSASVEVDKLITLRNIKILDCVSCNGISDKILKLIYALRRKVKVINYYTTDLGLYAEDMMDFY